MAATFSNPRWHALPCERMRGCVFADDFLSLAEVEKNYGTDTGTGNSIFYGLTADGNGYLEYDKVPIYSNLSVTFRFKTSSLASSQSYLVGSYGADGFAIWLTPTGLFANHSDGVAIPTACSIECSYDDEKEHTVTYTVDLDGGNHTLYYDTESDSQTTTASASASGTFDGDNVILGGPYFVGTLYAVRMFDAILTEDEHAVYQAGKPDDFYKALYSCFRCDSVCDDTVGHYAWDRTPNIRDITLGDGSAAATMPTQEDDHYLFDSASEYVQLPTLPDDYTISALATYLPWGLTELSQENDDTFSALIESAGSFSGYLHNLLITDSELTQLELYQAAYLQKYDFPRSRATGYFARLIHEGVMKLCMLAGERGNGLDYSLNGNNGVLYDVTTNGVDGMDFPNAASHIEVTHDSSLQTREGTIFLYGVFDGTSAGTWVDSGAKYKFYYNASLLILSGSNYGYSLSNNTSLAVTFRHLTKPRFYVDGYYIGEGSINTVISNVDTTELTIGNNNELNNRCQQTIKDVCIINKRLTDDEIQALHRSAQIVEATTMAVSNAAAPHYEFSGVAVDIDLSITSHATLFSIDVSWTSAAPTTSENITVKILNADGNSPTLYEWDPTVDISSDDTCLKYFNKRINTGSVVQVDYANTDAEDIEVNIYWQTEELVI